MARTSPLALQECEICGRAAGMHARSCERAQTSLLPADDKKKPPPLTAAQRKQRQREKEQERIKALEVRAGFANLQGEGGHLPVHQTVKDDDKGDPMRWSAVPSIDPPEVIEGEPQAQLPPGAAPPKPGQPEAVTAALGPMPPTADELAGAEKFAGVLRFLWTFGGAAAGELAGELLEDPKISPIVKIGIAQAVEHWNDALVTDAISVAGREFAIKYGLAAQAAALQPPCEVIVGAAVVLPVLAIAANTLRKGKRKREDGGHVRPIDAESHEPPARDVTPEAPEAAPGKEPDWSAVFGSALGNIPQGES